MTEKKAIPMALPGNGQTRNGATILVVEDDAAILGLVQEILKGAKYEILSANSANEGLRIGTEFPRPIHLLLSDEEMPGMAGPDLATKLKVQRPDMRVMLMSGHADGALLILNFGWHFIRKPFVATVLLDEVKTMLTSTVKEQSTDQFDTRVREEL